jgi:hypothetical protein
MENFLRALRIQPETIIRVSYGAQPRSKQGSERQGNKKIKNFFFLAEEKRRGNCCVCAGMFVEVS